MNTSKSMSITNTIGGRSPLLGNMGCLALIIALSGTLSAAVPRLGDQIEFKQNPAGLVSVEYKIMDAAGIVTVDFLTNGVSIGAVNYNNVYGDVNKLIEPSETESRRIYWRPSRSWPEGGKIDNGFTAKVTVWPKETPPDYLVIDLLGTKPHGYYVSEAALPGANHERNERGVHHEIYKTHKLVMRRVPAEGVTFIMGSPVEGAESIGRDSKSETPHQVTFTKDFYLSVFTMTQGQWQYLGGGAEFPQETIGPVLPRGSAYPATGFSYNKIRGSSWPSDAATHDMGGATDTLLAKMRARYGIGFDLPTDAQWEYACKAGAATTLYNNANIPSDWWWYDTPGEDHTYAPLDEIAWFNMNSAVNGVATIHEVGLKKANKWGFYDMIGNVWEWTLDWAERISYDPRGEMSADPVTDPVGLAQSAIDGRVMRGGACDNNILQQRTSKRWRFPEYIQGDHGGCGETGYGAIRLMCPIGLVW